MSGFLLDSGSQLKLEYYDQPSVMRYTHVHPQYELYFCPQSIRQKSVVNGEEHWCDSPCAILSTPYTVHSMSCAEPNSERYERYVFYFSEETVSCVDQRWIPDGFSRRSMGQMLLLNEEQARQLTDILALYPHGGAAAERELLFLLFLHRLWTLCDSEHRVTVGTGSSYIQRVVQWIAEHFGEGVSTQMITQAFSVSRSKLDRDFKRSTGITVHEFLDVCRLNQAKYLLGRRSRPSVREIAARCGFSDPGYFYPFFKKHTAMTPEQYRDRILASVSDGVEIYKSTKER